MCMNQVGELAFEAGLNASTKRKDLAAKHARKIDQSFGSVSLVVLALRQWNVQLARVELLQARGRGAKEQREEERALWSSREIRLSLKGDELI